jgi:hypothetical protein
MGRAYCAGRGAPSRAVDENDMSRRKSLDGRTDASQAQKSLRYVII